MALVEPPGAAYGDPVAVGGVEREVGGGDRAAQQRGVEHVGEQVVFDEQLAAGDGLGAALVGQGDVDPAGEEVLGVPVALAVAEQDQGAAHDGASVSPAVASSGASAGTTSANSSSSLTIGVLISTLSPLSNCSVSRV